MFPLIVSRFDMAGGAARAALRLGVALNGSGIRTEMLATTRDSDLPWVLGRKSFAGNVGATLRSHAGLVASRLQTTSDVGLRSFNLLPSRLDRTINALPHDVVNLHWIGAEMLSIEAVGRITKPVVWTLHDMWAFTGAEHYASEGPQARWRTGYVSGGESAADRGLDLDRATWRRKKKAWSRPQHVVSPSRWLADCAKTSALMADWPVHVVPNPLDLQVFRPWPKALAREMLGLPVEAPLLGFGAMGGTRDPRKGWDLLFPTLQAAGGAGIGAEAVIFGQSRPLGDAGLPMPSHWTGHLSDDITLALLYSAVDVVVVPSRQDNLPQTATEPQACGCPVVAFQVGGLPDAVEHGVTGLLAPPFGANDLAALVVRLLSDAELRSKQSTAARERAVREWSNQAVVSAYRRIYKAAINDS